jgi:hypothetical protein
MTYFWLTVSFVLFFMNVYRLVAMLRRHKGRIPDSATSRLILLNVFLTSGLCVRAFDILSYRDIYPFWVTGLLTNTNSSGMFYIADFFLYGNWYSLLCPERTRSTLFPVSQRVGRIMYVILAPAAALLRGIRLDEYYIWHAVMLSIFTSLCIITLLAASEIQSSIRLKLLLMNDDGITSGKDLTDADRRAAATTSLLSYKKYTWVLQCLLLFVTLSNSYSAFSAVSNKTSDSNRPDAPTPFSFIVELAPEYMQMGFAALALYVSWAPVVVVGESSPEDSSDRRLVSAGSSARLHSDSFTASDPQPPHGQNVDSIAMTAIESKAHSTESQSNWKDETFSRTTTAVRTAGHAGAAKPVRRFDRFVARVYDAERVLSPFITFFGRLVFVLDIVSDILLFTNLRSIGEDGFAFLVLVFMALPYVACLFIFAFPLNFKLRGGGYLQWRRGNVDSVQKEESLTTIDAKAIDDAIDDASAERRPTWTARTEIGVHMHSRTRSTTAMMNREVSATVCERAQPYIFMVVYMVLGIPLFLLLDLVIVTWYAFDNLSQTVYMIYYQRVRYLVECVAESLPQLFLQVVLFQRDTEVSLSILIYSTIGSSLSLLRQAWSLYRGARANVAAFNHSATQLQQQQQSKAEQQKHNETAVPIKQYLKTIFTAGVYYVPYMDALNRRSCRAVSFAGYDRTAPITSRQLRKVLQQACNCKAFHTLNLSGNSQLFFDERTISTLNTYLPKLRHLGRLNLSDNALSNRNMESIVPTLARMPALRELWLADNSIGVDGLSLLCDIMSQESCNIEHLDLSNNPITPAEAAPLLHRMLRSNNTLLTISFTHKPELNLTVLATADGQTTVSDHESDIGQHASQEQLGAVNHEASGVDVDVDVDVDDDATIRTDRLWTEINGMLQVNQLLLHMGDLIASRLNAMGITQLQSSGSGDLDQV